MRGGFYSQDDANLSYNLTDAGPMVLPFTHKLILKILTTPQEESFTHELQLRITVPH